MYLFKYGAERRERRREEREIGEVDGTAPPHLRAHLQSPARPNHSPLLALVLWSFPTQQPPLHLRRLPGLLNCFPLLLRQHPPPDLHSLPSFPPQTKSLPKWDVLSFGGCGRILRVQSGNLRAVHFEGGQVEGASLPPQGPLLQHQVSPLSLLAGLLLQLLLLHRNHQTRVSGHRSWDQVAAPPALSQNAVLPEPSAGPSLRISSHHFTRSQQALLLQHGRRRQPLLTRFRGGGLG